MDIQNRLTGFAMTGATWIMWILVALSAGGTAFALERAISLILASQSARKLKGQILGLLRRGVMPASPLISYACRFDVQ